MAKKTSKTVTKKVAQKSVVKKAVKKTVAAKAPVKKAAKKAVAKKTGGKAKTTIVAKIDIGFGRLLYLRGEGAGLSWDQGVPMDCVNSDEWKWSTNDAPDAGLIFKFIIDDEEDKWAIGENLEVARGGSSISAPIF